MIPYLYPPYGIFDTLIQKNGVLSHLKDSIVVVLPADFLKTGIFRSKFKLVNCGPISCLLGENFNKFLEKSYAL